MTTAIDVIRYIKSKTTVYGEMHAHKLLYYAQAWTLAWDGQPLFDETIEAWEQGPVVPALRQTDLWPLDVPSEMRFFTADQAWKAPACDDVDLTPQQRANIDAVIAYYGKYRGGSELSDLTHSESPWRDTWGDRPAGSRGTDPISHTLMLREYTRQSIDGSGPTRQVVQDYEPIPRDELLATASQTSRQWDRTLELLTE